MLAASDTWLFAHSPMTDGRCTVNHKYAINSPEDAQSIDDINNTNIDSKCQ